MKNLYCVNLFKGTELEGQKFVLADTTLEAKEKAKDNEQSCQEFDYVPVRIIVNTGRVFPVKKDEVMDEFKNPTYKDSYIVIDEFNISIIEFQDDDDEIGVEITYDTAKSNELSLVMKEGYDLFDSLVGNGTIDSNSTKEYSIIVTNKRTEEVKRVYIKINQ